MYQNQKGLAKNYKRGIIEVLDSEKLALFHMAYYFFSNLKATLQKLAFCNNVSYIKRMTIWPKRDLKTGFAQLFL
jgi:hypothetical protein